MKRVLMVTGVATLLFGCSSTQAAEEGESRFTTIYNGGAYGNDIIQDTETKCKYVTYNSVGGITPLLRSDGRPDCD